MICPDCHAPNGTHSAACARATQSYTLAECRRGDTVSIPTYSNHLLVGDRCRDCGSHVRVDEITALGSLGEHHWLDGDTMVAERWM